MSQLDICTDSMIYKVTHKLKMEINGQIQRKKRVLCRNEQFFILIYRETANTHMHTNPLHEQAHYFTLVHFQNKIDQCFFKNFFCFLLVKNNLQLFEKGKRLCLSRITRLSSDGYIRATIIVHIPTIV